MDTRPWKPLELMDPKSDVCLFPAQVRWQLNHLSTCQALIEFSNNPKTLLVNFFRQENGVYKDAG